MRFLSLGVSLALLPILSRLIPPREFGLLAMTTVTVQLLGTLKDFGLTSVAIQKVSLSEEDRSALFWMNLISTAAVACLVALVSPLIALFYSEPKLQGLLMGAAAGFFLMGIGSQHLAVLRRDLSLGRVFLAEGGSLVAGAITTVSLAYWRADAWAVIIGVSVQGLVFTLASLALGGWLPKWNDGLRSRLNLALSGASVALYSVLNYLTNNVGLVVLGYAQDARAMGLYYRAQSLYTMPTAALLSPYFQVQFTVMSRLSNDPDQLRRVYMGTVRVASMFLIPAGLVLPVISERLVVFVLGEQWREAGAIFLWFGPSLVALGFIGPAGFLLMSQGRFSDLRRWGVAEFLLRGGGAAAGALHSPAAAAAGFSLSTLIVGVPMLVWLCARGGAVTARDQMAAAAPGIAIGIASLLGAMVATVLIGNLDIIGLLAQLFVLLFCSGLGWLLMGLALPPTQQILLRRAT